MSVSDPSDAAPPRPAPDEPAKDERARRLADALRANLRRRKAQARALSETPESRPDADRSDV